MGLLLPTTATAADSHVASLEMSTQSGERPQWRDVGMCDVLAVTGASTVAAPTTVRVVHDNPTGTATAMGAAQVRHYKALQVAACSQRRPVSGYIYLIRCLRL